MHGRSLVALLPYPETFVTDTIGPTLYGERSYRDMQQSWKGGRREDEIQTISDASD
jgi:hypothetical protein